ncbi:hypothetical protein P879_02535 [Paragonimus westermani]|uniref:Uncharacterized protein n=1 Tax=Paragonimus westermani TaxID=34504 RepID=A0A8T0DKP3_9TREM|nr:hypothetical protein P879_02535 [Paragonimus westermani]
MRLDLLTIPKPLDGTPSKRLCCLYSPLGGRRPEDDGPPDYSGPVTDTVQRHTFTARSLMHVQPSRSDVMKVTVRAGRSSSGQRLFGDNRTLNSGRYPMAYFRDFALELFDKEVTSKLGLALMYHRILGAPRGAPTPVTNTLFELRGLLKLRDSTFGYTYFDGVSIASEPMAEDRVHGREVVK